MGSGGLNMEIYCMQGFDKMNLVAGISQLTRSFSIQLKMCSQFLPRKMWRFSFYHFEGAEIICWLITKITAVSQYCRETELSALFLFFIWHFDSLFSWIISYLMCLQWEIHFMQVFGFLIEDTTETYPIPDTSTKASSLKNRKLCIKIEEGGEKYIHTYLIT